MPQSRRVEWARCCCCPDWRQETPTRPLSFMVMTYSPHSRHPHGPHSTAPPLGINRTTIFMIPLERKISTTAELLAAAADADVRQITVLADLTELPTFRLSPGQTLTAADPKLALRFAAGQDGLQLSTDNRVEGLELGADLDRRALFNDT